MIKGPVYPIILPFNNKKDIDISSLQRYISYIVDGGGKYIMVASATSRFSQLSTEEIKTVNKVTIESTIESGGVPIASTPISGSTKTHIEVAQQAERDGAEIVICEYPWRYQGSGPLIDYFKEIVNNTNLDVMLHVTPTRSEVETSFGKTHRYEIDDLVEICSLPRVIGFKEAAGDPEHSEKIWRVLGKSTSIIVAVAASETFLKARPYGATGFFTGIESIFPRFGKEVYDLILNDDKEKSSEIVSQMSDLLHSCKNFGWHAASKYCLFKLGIMGIDEREPMNPISEEAQKILDPKIETLIDIYGQYS